MEVRIALARWFAWSGGTPLATNSVFKLETIGAPPFPLKCRKRMVAFIGNFPTNWCMLIRFVLISAMIWTEEGTSGWRHQDCYLATVWSGPMQIYCMCPTWTVIWPLIFVFCVYQRLCAHSATIVQLFGDLFGWSYHFLWTTIHRVLVASFLIDWSKQCQTWPFLRRILHPKKCGKGQLSHQKTSRVINFLQRLG